MYEAQDIAWDAWDAPDPARRMALAKKALAVSPLCADGYVILADMAEAGSDEQLALWRRGVHEEAIGHLQAVLALNPDDNQGARYLLAGWLAQAERGGELESLLAAYGDEWSAFGGWTKALVAFRKGGDGVESRALLAEAVAINRHVGDDLCGARKAPRREAPYYSPGDASEGVVYLKDYAAAWRATPGALDWLRAQRPAGSCSECRAAQVRDWGLCRRGIGAVPRRSPGP